MGERSAVRTLHMPLAENHIARREGNQVILRPTPLRVRWELAQTPSVDGHALLASFACSVRAVADRTERRMLEEVLLGNRSALTAEDVSTHFQPALQSAAARTLQQHPASAWMADESLKQQLSDALKSAAVSVAFAC